MCTWYICFDGRMNPKLVNMIPIRKGIGWKNRDESSTCVDVLCFTGTCFIETMLMFYIKQIQMEKKHHFKTGNKMK